MLRTTDIVSLLMLEDLGPVSPRHSAAAAAVACILGKGAEQKKSQSEVGKCKVDLNEGVHCHCLGEGKAWEKDKDLSQTSPRGSLETALSCNELVAKMGFT